MKISYGYSTLINFKYFFLIVILAVLLTESLFFELIIGQTTPESDIGWNLEKYLIPLSFLITVIFIFKFPTLLQAIVGVNIIYVLVFAFESYGKYGTYFIYPHVFSKILNFFIIYFTYLFFKDVDSRELKKIAYLIIIAFVLNLVLYKLSILNFSSFLQTERGFSSSGTYLLLFVSIYFLNLYMETSKFYNLFIFFISMGLVVFLQHRSVWVSGAVALFINMLLLITKSRIKVSTVKIVPIFIIPLVGLFLLLSFLIIDNPEIIKKFQDRFSDIQNYKSEGTGSWRYEQFQSYWPFVEEELWTGLRFKGFELPIQFYHPEAGVPFFNDGTGHHFHSFYLDKLFYLGIVGFLIVIAPLGYFLIIAFNLRSYNIEQITFISFLISSLIFGISYNWPIYIYGFLGIGIAFILQGEEVEQEHSLENSSDRLKVGVDREYV